MGKSTLLLQALGRMAARRRPLPPRHRRGVVRAGAHAGRAASARSQPDLLVVAETSLAARPRPRRRRRARRCSRSTPSRPSLDPDLPGAPGSVTQVRDCAYRLVQHAKERGLATVLVGHVTKEGTLAGPRVLEHVVDTVLSFDGDRGHSLRMLHALKHRFGGTDELGLFEMTERGSGRRARRVGALPRRPSRRACPARSSPRCSRARGRCWSRCRRWSCARRAGAAARSAAGIDVGRLGDAPRGARAQRGGIPLGAATSTRASPAGCASPSPASTSRSRSRSPAPARRVRSRGTVVDRRARPRRRGAPGAADRTPARRGGAARVHARGRPVRRARRDARGHRASCRCATCVEPALGAGVGRTAWLSTGEPGVACGIADHFAEATDRDRQTSLPVPAPPRSEAMMVALRLVAPGTPLREGLDRILQAHMGALIVDRRRARGALGVLGRLPARRRVHAAAALRAGQDGRRDHPRLRRARASRRANVHLVPDPNVPTSETGTRHRTAERVGRQIDVPVITVSEEMSRGRDPPPGREAHARADPARARPCRPGAADPRPLQGAPRRGERLAVGARGRRPRDRARRRHRAAARRDGAAHRRGDRGLRRRARRRRPAGDAPARGARSAASRTTAGSWPRTTSSRATTSSCVDVMHRAAPCSTTKSSSTSTTSRRCSTSSPSVGIDSALQPRGFRLLHKIPRLPETVSDHVVARFSNRRAAASRTYGRHGALFRR